MKEKDYIEELILNNLKELNNDEPPAGHFERFEAKLKGTNQKKKIISLNLVWKVAAAAVFAFLIVNQAAIWFSPENGNESVEKMASGTTLASISPEYEEVEFYFTSAISGGLSQWEQLVSEGLISEDEQQMMNNELNEFEEVYKNLQADLSANPNDERVINAMLEYYQTKLSLIHMILEKLEEVKQKTKTNYETES
ncbi:MAG: hypothetical protein V2I31_04035 [Mariniphaga sp.]|jgi:hypothetical protein|nr:hypothetical protein [Mariniphaga sp.]